MWYAWEHPTEELCEDISDVWDGTIIQDALSAKNIDIGDVLFLLNTDGFQVFKRYSAWPEFLMLLNVPPQVLVHLVFHLFTSF